MVMCKQTAILLCSVGKTESHLRIILLQGFGLHAYSCIHLLDSNHSSSTVMQLASCSCEFMRFVSMAYCDM